MEYTGTYGGSNTPCIIYEYDGWYVIEGSTNVNFTHDKLYNGIDTELITDYDTFQSDNPILSIEDLEEELSTFLEDY